MTKTTEEDNSQEPALSGENCHEKTIRWGIVGLGDVCQKKSGPAFWKCHGSSLVAVMRRTPGMAAAFAKEQVPGGECVGYESLEEFLQHPGGLDAVYVSTRPGTHLDICQQVAKAGIPCYVEKPVGRCAQETEKIVQLFYDKKVPLYTAYISRAYNRTQVVKRLLREGAIGDSVTTITYRLTGMGGARDMDRSDGTLPWRLNAKQSGGGLIMDVGCHILDRIDYLCGPLTNISGQAMCQRKGLRDVGTVEDYVHLTATIGSGSWAAMSGCKGAYVECTWDFASSEEATIDEIKLTGPKGSIQLAGMQPAAPVLVYNLDGKLLQEFFFDMPEHTAQQLIQAVTDDLRGLPREEYLSVGDNAIRTSQAMDAALNSYYGGREIGYWDRPESWPGVVTAC